MSQRIEVEYTNGDFDTFEGVSRAFIDSTTNVLHLFMDDEEEVIKLPMMNIRSWVEPKRER